MDAKIIMKNNDSIMYMLQPGTYEVNNPYKYVSFFAVDTVFELTLKGFKYEVKDIKLTKDNPLCISNEGNGTISFIIGTLLVIHQNEKTI